MKSNRTMAPLEPLMEIFWKAEEAETYVLWTEEIVHCNQNVVDLVNQTYGGVVNSIMLMINKLVTFFLQNLQSVLSF